MNIRAGCTLQKIYPGLGAESDLEPEGLTIQAKCESLNPGGCVKDRFAKHV